MQTNLTGKQINQFAQSRNDIPRYFGDRYYPFGYYGKTDKRINGEFLSKKYKAIAELIQETKATVNILPEAIEIKYNNGQAIIDRDLLTDTFLLPLLNLACIDKS